MSDRYINTLQTKHPIGYGLYNMVQDINMGDSTTPVDLGCECIGSRILEPGFLTTGKTLLIRASGVVKTKAKGQLHLELRANGNTIISTASPLVNNLKNEYRFYEIEIDVSVREVIGTTAPIVANGQWVYSYKDDTALTNTYEGSGFLSPGARIGQNPAVNIDPTVNQLITIYGHWEDADTDNDLKVHSSTIYVC